MKKEKLIKISQGEYIVKKVEKLTKEEQRRHIKIGDGKIGIITRGEKPILTPSDNDLIFEAVGIARTEIDNLWQDKGHLMSMKIRQELLEKASRLNDLYKKMQDC